MTRLSFKVRLRGSVLHVDISSDGVTYSLASGDELSIAHWDESLRLTPETAVSRPLAPPDERTPTQ